MIFGLLALTTAALFTGAAIYVNVAEQPARLQLDDKSLLAEWKPSYKYGRYMQASLAIVASLLGLIAFFDGWHWRWLIGALLIAAPWPYTLRVIQPTNTTLMAVDPANIGPNTRALIQRWGWLHVGRSALGVLATIAYIWAAAVQVAPVVATPP